MFLIWKTTCSVSIVEAKDNLTTLTEESCSNNCVYAYLLISCQLSTCLYPTKTNCKHVLSKPKLSSFKCIWKRKTLPTVQKLLDFNFRNSSMKLSGCLKFLWLVFLCSVCLESQFSTMCSHITGVSGPVVYVCPVLFVSNPSSVSTFLLLLFSRAYYHF